MAPSELCVVRSAAVGGTDAVRLVLHRSVDADVVQRVATKLSWIAREGNWTEK